MLEKIISFLVGSILLKKVPYTGIFRKIILSIKVYIMESKTAKFSQNISELTPLFLEETFLLSTDA